jgi:V/A-type H+-transporting ATPase subunit C
MTQTSPTEVNITDIVRKLLPSTGNYPYVTARVRAKRAHLLTWDTYAKLLVMDVNEITRFLGESQYKKEITELGLLYTGFELTERALNKNRDETYRQILRFSEGDLYTMLAAYLESEDVWNLKTILRGFHNHIPAEEILQNLRAGGRYPSEYWKHLIDNSKTLEDIITHLKDTPYHEALHDLLPDFNLATAENRLEAHYYARLLTAIRPNTEANRSFHDYIHSEIDLVNLKTLFLTKYENVEPKAIHDMIIPDGTIPDKTLTRLINAPDFTHFLTELQRLPIYDSIRTDIETIEKTRSLASTIRALEKDHLLTATKSSYLHPLSILPVIDYLTRKRIEVQNLRILARGKEKGLPTDTIRSLLVVP